MAKDLSQELEFVDEQERLYFAEVELGYHVRDFLVSPAGRYLHGRAKLELEEVKAEMLEINPFSFFGRRRWQALKLRQATAEKFMQWCAEAISKGTQAETAIEEYRT